MPPILWSQGVESAPIHAQVIRQIPHLDREAGEAVDDSLVAMRRANVTLAVALGIQVGDAALADVLNGTSFVLGSKPSERK